MANLERKDIPYFTGVISIINTFSIISVLMYRHVCIYNFKQIWHLLFPSFLIIFLYSSAYLLYREQTLRQPELPFFKYL